MIEDEPTVEEVQNLVNASTEGPWHWFCSHNTYRSVYLATKRWGRRFVMDFVRYGMQGAAPRFQVHDGEDRGLMYRCDELGDEKDHNGDYSLSHPDARLIALAPVIARMWLRDKAELKKIIEEMDK